MHPYRRSNRVPSLDLPDIQVAAQKGLEQAVEDELRLQPPKPLLKTNLPEILALFYCTQTRNRINQGYEPELIKKFILPQVGQYCIEQQRSPEALRIFIGQLEAYHRLWELEKKNYDSPRVTNALSVLDAMILTAKDSLKRSNP